MSDKENHLLKYFFIYGISEEVKNDLRTNGFNENNKIKPTILSSYSAEGKTEIFEALKNRLNEDYFLQNNIFPIKEDYLCNVNFPLDILEAPTLKIKSNPFNQYIYTVSSFDEEPQPFNHCFQYIFKIDENTDYNTILNFTVLIFYENVKDEKDLFGENQQMSLFSSLSSLIFNNSNYIFVAKAILLISEKPIFSLMREILK